MRCWTEKKLFTDEVRRDTAISRALGKEKLDELFNPARFLKEEETVFKRVFGA